jgi:CspA family cold shock protein
MTGTVKWFEDRKGYGYIISDDQQEYFVHYTSIIARGYHTLRTGQRVQFTIKEQYSLSSAENVQAIETQRPIAEDVQVIDIEHQAIDDTEQACNHRGCGCGCNPQPPPRPFRQLDLT